MIALDPNQTFEVLFDLEADRPDAQRKALVCRYPTARQLLTVLDHMRRGMKEDTPVEEEIPLLAAAIAQVAARWRNCPDLAEPTIDSLQETLSLTELREVALKIGGLSRLTEVEKKASALRSQSAAAARSAETAPAAGA